MGILSDSLNLLSAPGDYARGVLSGAPGERRTARQMLEGYGFADPDDDSFLGGVRDFMVGVGTDPLTYAAGGIGLLGKAAPKVGSLLGMRRPFSMAHGVDETTGVAKSVLGGTAQTKEVARDVGSFLAEEARQARAVGGSTPYGGYLPSGDAGAALASAKNPLATGRHEVVHGMIDQIAKGAIPGEGAPALMRGAAALYKGAGEKGARRGLAEVADELAAQSLENRGLLKQIRGGTDFLVGQVPEVAAARSKDLLFGMSSLAGKGGMSPGVRAGYADYFKRFSPLVGGAYQHLPEIGRWGVPAATAGAAAGGGALWRALRGEMAGAEE